MKVLPRAIPLLVFAAGFDLGLAFGVDENPQLDGPTTDGAVLDVLLRFDRRIHEQFDALTAIGTVYENQVQRMIQVPSSVTQIRLQSPPRIGWPGVGIAVGWILALA